MKKTGRILCFCLLLASLFCLTASGLVLAQEDGEQKKEEKIELEPTYRKLEETYAGAGFNFEITLRYTGPETGATREFDLAATTPSGWTAIISPSYGEGQKLLSIRLEANQEYPTKIRVSISPPTYATPEPGEYEITVEANSGALRGSTNLVAVIGVSYSLQLLPVSEVYSTNATSGNDNWYSIIVRNSGQGTVENITLSSSKPTGWSVDFTPASIEELAPGSFQTIDVNIKPTAKAIAGDYQISLAASAKNAVKSMDIRVTVETPTLWGWVGIGIILAVIAGVAFIFMRFSRR